MRTATSVGHRQPVFLDVRVQKSEADDKLSFPHHRGDIKVVGGEVLPETHALAMASPQRQNSTWALHVECTYSRHVQSDGCGQVNCTPTVDVDICSTSREER